ncbi:MAG: PEGA domain-containing protein [Acidobacteriota bacterium]
MKKRILQFALLAGLLSVAMPAVDAQGFRGGFRGGYGYRGGFRGGIVIGPSYGPWGYWGPYGYGYGYPGYYGGFGFSTGGMRPNSGQVKLDTKEKNAEVYINGAYSGLAKDLKTSSLKPGDYDLELRAPSGERYATRIYVVAGKTIHIRPDLPADHN